MSTLHPDDKMNLPNIKAFAWEHLYTGAVWLPIPSKAYEYTIEEVSQHVNVRTLQQGIYIKIGIAKILPRSDTTKIIKSSGSSFYMPYPDLDNSKMLYVAVRDLVVRNMQDLQPYVLLLPSQGRQDYA